jgi:hypothetical protein
MTDIKKLSEFAEKASDIVHEKGLADISLTEKMIMFRDPDAPKEALGLVYDEDIEALAKKMKVEYTVISRSDITSMRISKVTLQLLEQVKEHPREPVESVVNRLLTFWNGHSDCEDMKKPMDDDLKVIINGALEKKFKAKSTGILDLENGTEFRFEGDPEGTPVLIPKR